MKGKEYSKSELVETIRDAVNNDNSLVVDLSNQLLRLMLMKECTQAIVRLTPAEGRVIALYGKACWQAQQAAPDSRSWKMPKLPPMMSKQVRVIIMAYRNMAKAWAITGGCVPDPCDHLNLLYVMGCNGIRFDRRPHHGNNKVARHW